MKEIIHFIDINRTSEDNVKQWFFNNNKRSSYSSTVFPYEIIRSFKREVFYFTVVRNPYSRLVSQFLHSKDILKIFKDDVDFSTYIKNLRKPSVYCKSDKLKDYPVKFHFSCSDWLGDYQKNVEIFQYEYLGILEGFFNFYYGMEKNLERDNDTPDDRYYFNYYDQETLEIVNTIMAKDFHNFDYEMVETIHR